MGEFNTEIRALKNISSEGFEDIMSREVKTFCRSHFKKRSSCDIFDNNMAEIFNSFILLSRYKPIVSMLEDIRLAIMDRIRDEKDLSSKFFAGITPRISQKLEEAYDAQKYCLCKWNGDTAEFGFEVIQNGVGNVVDLGDRSFSCKHWDLTGILWAHAMSALLYMNQQSEDYLPRWYRVETYKDTYSSMIKPVSGSTLWDHEIDGMVVPPDIERKKKMGKKKTNRRKDKDEPPTPQNKYSRKGLPHHCSRCNSTDHTARRCPQPPPTKQPQPSQQREGHGKRKRGMPQGNKNRIGLPTDQIPAPSQYRTQLMGLKGQGRGFSTIESEKSSRPWL